VPLSSISMILILDKGSSKFDMLEEEPVNCKSPSLSTSL